MPKKYYLLPWAPTVGTVILKESMQRYLVSFPENERHLVSSIFSADGKGWHACYFHPENKEEYHDDTFRISKEEAIKWANNFLEQYYEILPENLSSLL